MKLTRLFVGILALGFSGLMAHAASVQGTVTNKTTGKPAAGDAVVLVEPMAGMAEVAHTTTDSKGHYSLDLPNNAPSLIRVTHQGAGYFISTPQGAAPADIAVYDVAPSVNGVRIEADVIEAEGDNGQLHIDERYFVHNLSTPPTTQWSKKSFSVVIPADATLAAANAQRPGGLPTSIQPDPNGPKGHYSFNFPIQPDDGDKDTMFQVSYDLPYSGGKYSFKSLLSLPADNLAVLLPKSMKFAGGSGASFSPVQADPGLDTYLAKNVGANQQVEFTVSGTGSLPQQGQGGMQQGDQSAATPANGPGGGIGEPINTPDPLSKYKWWILGGIGLLLVAAAAFLLRKPETAVVAAGGSTVGMPLGAVITPPSAPTAKSTTLLDALKEELFALESDKVSGKLTAEQYAEQKAALETVLKRALKRG